ncbi:MAG: serine protease, partial [Erysipelotrichia bacterium]|nr:serine protease [Erysipelotrichia bacterium]
TDSDIVQPGEYVIAIGGRRIDAGFGTVSFGVVSDSGYLQRAAEEDVPDWIVSVMECDVSVNQTNSGAPIVNLSGEAVGILSTNLTASAASSGMAYAVSGNEVKLAAEQLRLSGTVTRGYLGVFGRNISGMENYQKNALNIMLDQMDGVYVQNIVSGSPASGELAEGDIITAVDEQPVTDSASLLKLLYRHASGDLVTIAVIRSGVQQSINVSLG